MVGPERAGRGGVPGEGEELVSLCEDVSGAALTLSEDMLSELDSIAA